MALELFWRSVSLADVLKFRVIYINPLFLREKLGDGSSLLIAWYCARGGVYDQCVSHLFLFVLMWVFSNLPNM